MEQKIRKIILSFILSISFTISAQAGTITDGTGSGGPSAVLGNVGNYIIEMLMIPASLDPGPIAMWLGGMGFTIYAFRLTVENFDDKMGGWIKNSGAGRTTGSGNKEYWVIASLLTIMFVGGTNFMGWVTHLVMLLIVSAALLFFAIAIRAFWFSGSILGGTAMSVGHQARTGTLGKGARTAANKAQNMWGKGGAVDNMYSRYKGIPRCKANGHLNPGASSGDACWTGCGGNVK